MNKFVLKVFVILAIGMAEFPSTFGCPPDPRPPIRSVDAGGNVFELELEGFSICNTDGTEGLTFDEINACRVNYNFTQYVLGTYLIVNILEFQIRLGEFVIYSWPTASDFDAADENGDGNLTIDEFVQYLG